MEHLSTLRLFEMGECPPGALPVRADQPRLDVTASTQSDVGTSGAEVLPEPVECESGCRGTTACLCGQGELSDDPVWIERDLSTW